VTGSNVLGFGQGTIPAFDAVRSGQPRSFKWAECDGPMNLPGRSVPLAGPVQRRIGAWLATWLGGWPGTVNPHSFLKPGPHQASRTSAKWFARCPRQVGQVICEDRILYEAIAATRTPNRRAVGPTARGSSIAVTRQHRLRCRQLIGAA
jgi:hypothetical protein